MSQKKYFMTGRDRRAIFGIIAAAIIVVLLWTALIPSDGPLALQLHR
jgi:hypothetical protein